MTFLRIFALVAVARLMIAGLETLFGEPATRNFLVAFLIYVSCYILYQRWRERA